MSFENFKSKDLTINLVSSKGHHMSATRHPQEYPLGQRYNYVVLCTNNPDIAYIQL